MVRPLLDLTKKSTEWHWKNDQQLAFEHLKQAMISKPVLQHPNLDKTFYLQTDALKYSVGAVLS